MVRLMARWAVASSLMAGFVASAFAWGATGHMVVADIALRNLDSKAKAECLRLLAINPTDKAVDFITTGPWADDIRSERKETATWHYTDLYFRADGQPTDLKSDAENGAWAVDKFSRVLADKSKPDAERAEALRFLIHIVGDLQQPLHGSSRVTDALPKGDKGGNSFYVESSDAAQAAGHRPKNLHSFWDGGAGAFTARVDRPLDADGKIEIDKLADLAVQTVGPSELSAARKVIDPMGWVKEDLELSKTFVYTTPENQTPSADYTAKAAKISMQRVTIGGYRLADLLNRLLS